MVKRLIIAVGLSKVQSSVFIYEIWLLHKEMGEGRPLESIPSFHAIMAGLSQALDHLLCWSP